MKQTLHVNGDEFTIERDMLEVTSLSRPDLGWRHTDRAGHEHRWLKENGEEPGAYDPAETYEVPSLVTVVAPTEDGFDEVLRCECRACGEHIEPGRCADAEPVYIAGLTRGYINGRPVTREEFERRFAEATGR